MRIFLIPSLSFINYEVDLVNSFKNTLKCKNHTFNLVQISVSEIKGAPCTQRARFSEVCTRSVHVFFFFENLSLLHIRRVHGENPGCTVLEEMHPVSARNKT